MKSRKRETYFAVTLIAFIAAINMSAKDPYTTSVTLFADTLASDGSTAAYDTSRTGDSLKGTAVLPDTTASDAIDSTVTADSINKSDSVAAANATIAGDSTITADTTAIADTLGGKTDFSSDSSAVQDSTVLSDSVQVADTAAPMTKRELRQAMKDSLAKRKMARRDSLSEIRWHRKDSIQYIKDSIRYIKDSIKASIPRILTTYIIPDSMKYKRILAWTNDGDLNSISFTGIDTTFNENYSEYPFFKKDLDAVYLGVAGSATVSANYFKRDRLREFDFFSPYLTYSYTPETMPFYNTKTPYTELAYWGTLFANKEKEESNVKFLSTQNLTPEANISVLYQRFGSNGMLKREDTDNRTFAFTGNYLGKRYVAHGGYIYQSVKRSENGGVADPWFITDTVMDVRTLAVNLKNASTKLKRHTVFLNHSYGIPIRWKKDKSDTLETEIGPESEEQAKSQRDTVRNEKGTVTYFGHSFEFSSYKKIYTDEIAADDETGRNFYRNKFYLHPTNSYDSVRVTDVTNKVYIRLQPWAQDAILSRIDAGVGHQYTDNFLFNPEFFLKKPDGNDYNNLFAYAGASGNYRKYFSWDGLAKYYFAGYNLNDLEIDANARFSTYPIPQGIHLTAHFNLESRRPGWYENNYVSNHFIWSNDFAKETSTSIEAQLDIPRIKLQAFFGYSLVNNMIYYDTLGIARQHNKPVSIMSAYLKKDFRLWNVLHLDNQILFQLSSDKNVLPLPLLTLNLRYYFQFELVRNVLTAQIGANAVFNTKYYIPAYNPAVGVFHTQNQVEYGNFPYIDFFINLQWKRASIFVKYVNASQQWFNKEYFSAYNYIRSQRAFKVGIHWPFYIK